MGTFKPKGKDELRKEAIAYVGKHLSDLDDTAKESVINKLTDKWLKDEEFKASEKNKTAKAREEAKQIAERKEHYKKLAGKSKGTGENGHHKADDYSISAEDRAYLHGRLGMTRTEVRLLTKAMKIEESPKWEKVLSSKTFKAMKDENDSLIRKNGGSIGASRGGHRDKSKTEEIQIAEKLSGNLPPGFSDKDPDKK